MKKNHYLKTTIKLIKFVVFILAIDFLLGTFAKHIFFSQETGKYARATHAIQETEADVLIFGSSHAHRHYIPNLFEELLQKTCYNAGAEGQQLLYHTVLQQMILKRTQPELIILNIDKDFLFTSQEAYDRLGDLHPYYEEHREELKPILGLKSKLVDVKLFFKSYQTNSTIVHAIRYYLSPQVDYKGYRPLQGEANPDQKLQDDIKILSNEIDPNFESALYRFIETARNKDVKLVFVTSPKLYRVDTSNNASFNRIKEIAKEKNVMFIDFFNAEEFLKQYELFHDPSHLNHNGAKKFNTLIIDQIKNQYKWE